MHTKDLFFKYTDSFLEYPATTKLRSLTSKQCWSFSRVGCLTNKGMVIYTRSQATINNWLFYCTVSHAVLKDWQNRLSLVLSRNATLNSEENRALKAINSSSIWLWFPLPLCLPALALQNSTPTGSLVHYHSQMAHSNTDISKEVKVFVL